MLRALSGSFIIAIFLGTAAFAQSQSGESLGDVARENRAKQQGQQATGATSKVITNQDLPAGSTSGSQANESDPMTQVSGTAKTNRNADQRLTRRLQAQQRVRTQWRTRIQEQEDRVADLQARIAQVNAAMTKSVGTAQYETAANRDQAVQMRRLAALQQTLDQEKRKLATMQDAAQRAGMDQ